MCGVWCVVCGVMCMVNGARCVVCGAQRVGRVTSMELTCIFAPSASKNPAVSYVRLTLLTMRILYLRVSARCGLEKIVYCG